MIALAALAFIAVGCARAAPPEAVVPGCEAADPATNIPWSDAVDLIREGSVTAVSQNHCRDVRLDTADGEVYYTVEPAIDEVLRVIEESAPNKSEIKTVIE